MKWEEVKVIEIKAKTSYALSTGPFGSSIGSKFFQNEGVPVIRGGNLSTAISTRLDEEGLIFISEELAKKFERSSVRNGDLVFTCWGTINQIGLIDERASFEKYIVSNKQMKLTPDPEKVSSLFLYYYFSTFEVQQTILACNIGSSVPGFNLGQLKEFKVLLPPLPTQQKIASILSAYDDRIENNLKRIRLLEEAAQRLYQEWFVRFRFPGWGEVRFLEGLPEGWERVNLYDFANLKMGFPFKAEDFNEEKNGTPVIRIRDIPNHWTNTYSKSSTSDDYWVEKNDIIVGMDGFFYTDVWGGQRGYLVQRVCRIRPNDERFYGYLLEAIRDPIKYYEKTISGATVAHLGAKHLKEIEIIKPDEKMIPEITVFNHLIEQRVNLLLQNQKLKEARDILLPRLMNQTIEV